MVRFEDYDCNTFEISHGKRTHSYIILNNLSLFQNEYKNKEGCNKPRRCSGRVKLVKRTPS